MAIGGVDMMFREWEWVGVFMSAIRTRRSDVMVYGEEEYYE